MSFRDIRGISAGRAAMYSAFLLGALWVSYLLLAELSTENGHMFGVRIVFALALWGAVIACVVDARKAVVHYGRTGKTITEVYDKENRW